MACEYAKLYPNFKVYSHYLPRPTLLTVPSSEYLVVAVWLWSRQPLPEQCLSGTGEQPPHLLLLRHLEVLGRLLQRPQTISTFLSRSSLWGSWWPWQREEYRILKNIILVSYSGIFCWGKNFRLFRLLLQGVKIYLRTFYWSKNLPGKILVTCCVANI